MTEATEHSRIFPKKIMVELLKIKTKTQRHFYQSQIQVIHQPETYDEGTTKR